jgi:hypothetical protein
MSQNSLVIPTTGTLSGVALVTSVNGGLDSLNTLNSGGSAPSAPEADQWWMDTTNNVLKQRDGGNANWIIQRIRGVAHGGGIRHSGQTSPITASTILTSAQLGQLVLLGPTAPITLTLPLAATFSPGTGMILYNYGSAAVNFATQGSDTSDPQAWLNPGDSVWATSDGTSDWRYFFRSNNGTGIQSGSKSIVTATAYGSMFLGGTTVTFTNAYAAGYIPEVNAKVSATGGGGVGVIIASVTNTGFAVSAVGVTSSGSVTIEWGSR